MKYNKIDCKKYRFQRKRRHRFGSKSYLGIVIDNKPPVLIESQGRTAKDQLQAALVFTVCAVGGMGLVLMVLILKGVI